MNRLLLIMLLIFISGCASDFGFQGLSQNIVPISEFKFKSGINRPIKIVEKNKYVRGRRKQNELLARINFNLDQSSKTTLIVFDDIPINEEEYSKIEEQKRFKQDKLHSYDPNYWKDYSVIEPNQAIKSFKVNSN